MTCHNGDKYLEQALISLKKQTYKNWELIFWDNNSKDKSKIIFKKFKNKKMKYFKSNKTLKLGKVRQMAFEKCNGKFISFLDVDDLWIKNKLKLQVNKFNEDKKTGVVYGKYSVLRGKKIDKTKYPKFIKGKFTKDFLYSYIDGRPFTAWLTLMIKKKDIKKLNYAFNKRMHISTDLDLIVRLSKFCYFDYVNKYSTIYRYHDNNETNKHYSVEISELCYIFQKLRKIYFSNKINNYTNKLILKNFFLNKIQNKKSYILSSNINNYFYKIIYFLIKLSPSFILSFLLKNELSKKI
tara:strand:+ start:793 stop:1677 length:885 start_codon:yes stop_codon:yes gene_type:complete